MNANSYVIYKNFKTALKAFCILLAVANMLILMLDIYEMLPIRQISLKYAIFFSLLLITIHFLIEKEYELFLSLFSFALINNPFYPIYLPLMIFKVLEFITTLLFAYIIYFIFYSERAKYIENIAYYLDEYLKELDHTISGLSYHQISIYIHNRYPTTAKINEFAIEWKIASLPEVDFFVYYEDYAHFKNNKGQVKALFKDQFKVIEAYLNFNFSESVRFAVKMVKTKQTSPSYAARNLRYILVKRYHYIDLWRFHG